MDNLPEAIKKMEEAPFPEGLHDRIMRRVFFSQIRPTVLFILALLVFNIVISAWYTWTKMIEWETFSFIKAAMSTFEMSGDFVSDFAAIAIDSVPIVPVAIFLTNVFLAVVLVRFSSKLQKLSPTIH